MQTKPAENKNNRAQTVTPGNGEKPQQPALGLKKLSSVRAVTVLVKMQEISDNLRACLLEKDGRFSKEWLDTNG